MKRHWQTVIGKNEGSEGGEEEQMQAIWLGRETVESFERKMKLQVIDFRAYGASALTSNPSGGFMRTSLKGQADPMLLEGQK